jgi:hypothetical protein
MNLLSRVLRLEKREKDLSIKAIAFVQEEQAAGTDGGSTTASASHIRVLNTSYNLDRIGSLASNQVTLKPGRYILIANSPVYKTDTHQALIYDVTNSTVVGYGKSMQQSSSNAVGTDSEAVAYLNITSETTYEVRHWVATARATTGLGVASSAPATNPNQKEVYTRLTIYQLRS